MNQRPSGFVSTCRVLAVAAALAACAAPPEPFHTVDPANAAALIQAEAFLLDVRTPKENVAARIAGDALVPLQELERQGSALPEDKTKPVLVYCRSGNRSATASRILVRLGYERVYNLKDGIIGWKRAGLPVETGPRAEANGR